MIFFPGSGKLESNGEGIGLNHAINGSKPLSIL